MTPGPSVRVSIAIVFVSDMRRSVSFYRDVLGLPLEFESTHWTQFATGGAKLALHISEAVGTAAAPSSPEPPGRCRPGLSVADLDQFHQRMVEKKVACVQPPTETFGVRVAQYLDPDGLAISVAQDRRG